MLLIIDGAEKLPAATLERMVRLVMEEKEGKLSLLLAGRPELDGQLARMAQTGTAVVFAAALQLEPFTESDTRQYLRHRCMAAGMSREHFAQVFTETVITNILANAQGNPRLINTLAEESLQNCCAEKSFMVLLDHVEPEIARPPRSPRGILESFELLREHKRLTAGLVAAMTLLLLLGIVLYRGDAGSPSRQSPVMAPAESNLTPPKSSAKQRDADTLLHQRLAAGAGWLAAPERGGYTIQLMMLSSSSAEYSLAETLTQDDFYPLRDQFHILRTPTHPPTLFVFYGVYDSLEAAREARNNMPAFLRHYHPYPLAIGEAIRKIEP